MTQSTWLARLPRWLSTAVSVTTVLVMLAGAMTPAVRAQNSLEETLRLAKEAVAAVGITGMGDSPHPECRDAGSLHAWMPLDEGGANYTDVLLGVYASRDDMLAACDAYGTALAKSNNYPALGAEWAHLELVHDTFQGAGTGTGNTPAGASAWIDFTCGGVYFSVFTRRYGDVGIDDVAANEAAGAKLAADVCQPYVQDLAGRLYQALVDRGVCAPGGGGGGGSGGGTGGGALTAVLGCECNYADDPGLVVCQAGVTGQRADATPEYSWTFDGATVMGGESGVLQLQNVSAGEHTIVVTARDTTNNLTSDPLSMTCIKQQGGVGEPETESKPASTLRVSCTYDETYQQVVCTAAATPGNAALVYEWTFAGALQGESGPGLSVPVSAGNAKYRVTVSARDPGTGLATNQAATTVEVGQQLGFLEQADAIATNLLLDQLGAALFPTGEQIASGAAYTAFTALLMALGVGLAARRKPSAKRAEGSAYTASAPVEPLTPQGGAVAGWGSSAASAAVPRTPPGTAMSAKAASPRPGSAAEDVDQTWIAGTAGPAPSAPAYVPPKGAASAALRGASSSGKTAPPPPGSLAGGRAAAPKPVGAIASGATAGRTPNATGQPQAAQAGAWTCAQCGAANEAKWQFCSGCGVPRPQTTGWLCPTCSTQNLPESRFCGSCGAARPAPAAGWTCPRCKHANGPGDRFCVDCGRPRV